MAGLLQKQYQNEESARKHLEKILWSNGAVCPHCGVIEGSVKPTKTTPLRHTGATDFTSAMVAASSLR